MSDRRTGIPACPVRYGCKVDRQGRLSSCPYYNANFSCNEALVLYEACDAVILNEVQDLVPFSDETLHRV